MSNNEKTSPPSTLAALLKDKPKRGRPPRDVSRQNVYVSLTKQQKLFMKELAAQLPKGVVKADIPDLAVAALSARMEALRQAVSDRDREIPEGITDLDSLYLLWDLSMPEGEDEERKWTSIRLSPQPAIELGRWHGTLYAVFSANRSETFSLGLALFAQFWNTVGTEVAGKSFTLASMRKLILGNYL